MLKQRASRRKAASTSFLIDDKEYHEDEEENAEGAMTFEVEAGAISSKTRSRTPQAHAQLVSSTYLTQMKNLGPKNREDDMPLSTFRRATKNYFRTDEDDIDQVGITTIPRLCHHQQNAFTIGESESCYNCKLFPRFTFSYWGLAQKHVLV